MKRLKTIVLALLVLALVLSVVTWLVFRMPSYGGVFEGERLERMRQSKQYINGRIKNTPP